MPDTVDHRVEMYRLAQERQKAGQPVWDRKISVRDVFRNEAMIFEQRRDAIVNRLRTSGWFAGRDMFDELATAVEGLAGSDDAEEFDGWWDEIYDIADCDRVWIETR